MTPTKNVKKKTSKSKGKMIIPRFGVGFPTQLFMSHKYVDEFTLTAALGVMANYRFRASGMFDPNHTAAGHQPSYFDTMMGIYDHWIVLSSEIELTLIPTTNPGTPTAFGIALNDDVATVATSFTQYEEDNQVKVNYLSYVPSTVARLRLSYDAKRVFAGDPMDNRGLWGGIASDPGEETIFNVFLQAVDMVSSASCFCVARVTYNVIWFELKDLTVS